jgi:hypothetical protein
MLTGAPACAEPNDFAGVKAIDKDTRELSDKIKIRSCTTGAIGDSSQKSEQNV